MLVESTLKINVFLLILGAIIVLTPQAYAATQNYLTTENWVVNGKNFTEVNGPVWTNEGNGDGYYTFDGTNDYLNVADFLSTYNATTPFAFAIRWRPHADEGSTLLRWRYEWAGNVGNQFRTDTGGRLQVLSGQTFITSSNASAYYTPNTWAVATFEYNGSHLLMTQDCTTVYNASATLRAAGTSGSYVNDTLVAAEETDGTGAVDGDIDWIVLRLSDTFTVSERTSLCADSPFGIYEQTDQFFYPFWNGTYYNTYNLTANFSNVKGEIDENAYGTNNHGIWGGELSWIDTNNDGTLDTLSNYTFHRDQFSRMNLGNLRGDLFLESASSLTSFSNSTFNNANVENRRNLVAYAAANGIKFTGIASYMPTWLSDNASTCLSNNQRCAPTNYTTYAQLVVNYLDAIDCDVYQSTCRVEVWNEPDLGIFLLPDGTCAERTAVYVQLYNAVYDAVKAAYPSVEVIGPAVADSGTGACGHSLTGSFFGNSTILNYSWDAVSIHTYLPEDGSDFDSRLSFIIPNLQSLCSTYGVSCENIILSEFNVFATSILVGNNSGYEYQLNLGWIELFKNWPANISVDIYQTMEECNYGNYGCYNEYPKNFESYSEPLLSNTNYVPYNFTVNWTTRHPPRAQVVNTTHNANTPFICSNNTLAGQATGYYCTLASDLADNNVFNLTLTGISATSVTNLQTGYQYNLSGNTVELGVVNNQSFNYYKINGVTAWDTNITINSTSPVTPWTVAEPNNQTFSFTLNNIDAQEVSVDWSFNGTTQTSCANLTSCAFTGGYDTAGYYNITFTNVAPTNSVSYTWNFTVNNTVQNISFTATSPETPVSVYFPNGQLFSATVSNPDALTLYYTWFVDGVNQTGVYGQSSATVTASEGNYTVLLQVNSSANNLSYTWNYSVLAAVPVTVCSTAEQGVDGLINFARFFDLLVLAIILISLVSIIYGVYDQRNIMEIVELMMGNIMKGVIAVVIISVVVALGSALTLSVGSC